MEQGSGPKRSWMPPPMTKLSAKKVEAIVKTMEVSARPQPNRASSGATKMLQAYSVPSATFIERPPASRHHRLISCFCILDSQLDDPFTEPAHHSETGLSPVVDGRTLDLLTCGVHPFGTHREGLAIPGQLRMVAVHYFATQAILRFALVGAD